MLGERIRDMGGIGYRYLLVAKSEALGLGCYYAPDDRHMLLSRDGIVYGETAGVTLEQAKAAFESAVERFTPILDKNPFAWHSAKLNAEAASRRAAYTKNAAALYDSFARIYSTATDSTGSLLPSIRPAVLRRAFEQETQAYRETREDARDNVRQMAAMLTAREQSSADDDEESSDA